MIHNPSEFQNHRDTGGHVSFIRQRGNRANKLAVVGGAIMSGHTAL